MVNILEGMRKFKPASMSGTATAVIAGVKEPHKQPVSLDTAAQMVASLIKLTVPQGKAVDELAAKGYLSKTTLDGIANKQELTNGDTYMIIHDVYKQINTAK